MSNISILTLEQDLTEKSSHMLNLTNAEMQSTMGGFFSFLPMPMTHCDFMSAHVDPHIFELQGGSSEQLVA